MPQNSTPDVRIRLSAEGVQDVVNAFKRIQAEADKTGKRSKSAGDGVGFLGKQLQSLGHLLPMLTAAAVVTGFVQLTKQSLDLADSLGKLSQKTGLSVETLNTLSLGARTADVEQEALAKGMVKFSRSMNDYDRGLTVARDAVANLFGDSNALQGLSEDQRLLKIVDALSKLEPGARRTGLAMQFFGKSGADLLPLIDDLGSGGFDELRKKAEKLGYAMNDDLARAAQRAKDAMENVKTEVQGAALQFTAGFAPALEEASNALVEATTQDGVNGFRVLGAYAGKTLKGIVWLITAVSMGIVEIGAKTYNLLSRSAQFADDIIHGHFKQGWENFRTGIVQDADAVDAMIQKKEAAVLSALDGSSLTISNKRRKRDNSNSQLDASRAQTAALNLAQAEADAQLRVEQARQKSQEMASQEAYDKGLKSLREYYAERISIVQSQGDAEVAAAQKKLDALKNTPLASGELRDDRQTKIVQAQAALEVARLNTEQQIHTLKSQEAKEAEALQQKELNLEKQLQIAQQDRFAAARAAVTAEANQLDILLRQQGVADQERQNRVGAFMQAGYQRVDFSQLQDQAKKALDDLDGQRQQIEQSIANGQIFAFQGEQKIMDLDASRLPLLQQIADAMKATAVTPEQIQAARDLQSQIDQLSLSANRAAQEMAAFKQNASQAATSDLSNWLSSGVDQAESLADAFRSLALSVVQSLRQIAAQMLATYMIQKLLGMFMPTPSAGGGSGGGGVGVFAAEGGLIRGPGTATSDSIPARLSNYEYIVKANVVRQPGVLEALNTLNYGTPTVRRRGGTHFAEGGLVDVPAGRGGLAEAGLSATLELSPELALKKLQAHPAWKRAVIKTLGDNRKSANQALRRG